MMINIMDKDKSSINHLYIYLMIITYWIR